MSSIVSASSSRSRYQSSSMDPFSLTMYWEESAMVVSARVMNGWKMEEVKVEYSSRDRKVILLVVGEGGGSGSGFSRSLRLPANVNAGEMRREVNNGILTLTLPKKTSPCIVDHRRHGCFFR